MGNSDVITLTIILPFNETAALAQFVKRVDYDTVGRFTALMVTYGGRSEHDVAWTALSLG
jgi:hypothetical protein